MIKISKPQKYDSCDACNTVNNIKEIQTSVNGNQWSSICLCENCLKEICKKFKEV